MYVTRTAMRLRWETSAEVDGTSSGGTAHIARGEQCVAGLHVVQQLGTLEATMSRRREFGHCARSRRANTASNLACDDLPRALTPWCARAARHDGESTAIGGSQGRERDPDVDAFQARRIWGQVVAWPEKFVIHVPPATHVAWIEGEQRILEHP